MKRKKTRRPRKQASKQASKQAGKQAGRPPEQQTLTIQQVLDLAVQHHNGGRLPEAEGLYQQILQADPHQPIALHLLGLIAHQVGKNDQALDLITKALVVRPNYAEAHINLGIVLKELGRLDEAVASSRKALVLKPDNAEAHNNLGNTLKELGRFEEAVDSYHKVLALKPHIAEAHNNLGVTLHNLGRLDEAIASFNKALALKPDYAQAHNNLGNALKELGRLEEAVASSRKALSIKPDYAEAHYNLGNALLDMGRLDEAIASFNKALALKPDYAQAHNNLGAVLKDMGRLEEAISSYQKALVLKPDDETAAMDLLHQLRHGCAWSEIDELEPKVVEVTKRMTGEGGDVAPRPFDNITSRADAAENFAVARARSGEIAKKMSGVKTDFQFAVKSPGSRINIGYLSSDIHNHATAHLMLSLFGLHDRRDFNIFTFSHGKNDDSAYREKIINDSDGFFDLQGAGHLQAARQIFDSGVDILVDLKGHTQNSRLEICALRPAPVQATYLGFPGTSGADFLDYIITDRIVTPEDHAPYYSEQPVYMPHCYQINDHQQKISDIAFTRADLGLPEKNFVFCSFNSNYKIEAVMFGVWMNLLKQTPDSVLWLFKSNDMAERNLKGEAQARGVDPDRLIFAGKMPKDQHLARSSFADLALDTRIYGGHTTTSDSLWAGVPVVAMQGAHFASRVSASILTAAGLPELITHNLEDYQALALRLSRNPDELDTLKAKLAQNRLSQPLFDTPRFVANLETAYRRMWDQYLSGQAPARIDVTEST